MTKQEFLGYLHDGDFRQLFLECFWSNPSNNSPYLFPVGEETYEVREVAQKGLKVFVCNVAKIPDSSVRRLIDTKLRKLSHDYFVIFVSTSEPFHHLWSVPVKAVDKRTLVTVEYVQDDQALFLLEKMNALTFSIDENPTIIDVANRVNAAFLVNTTDVTKKFYQSFRKQHDMFVKGIENIAGKDEREWYASVMLNRLMFCYFIQKKRFLNFDENYLGNKLRETQAKKGKGRFYESFYRSFLKQLFSDGLDKPAAARSDYFLRKYGRIPYLNGGMFSMHQIEKENKDIDIPDKVFEKLFAFFDEWHWHLDNRITASGRDINPDVLGYIFEQYINDRAQMGAYYTKEDITEYIGRNCIVPWLWKKAVGDRDLNEVVDLKGSGDRYIFPAMRKGMEHELPPEIEKGVAVEPQKTLRARRNGWNKPASEQYALPTEIWRETVVRRQRCEEIRGKIAKGEIKNIHDFITYNLDIRTFAEDAIRSTADHKLVLHFYKALREITILDPTCGSGAFLFAGLNILEPLYEACLDRMEDFHAQNGNLFKDELAEITGKFRSNRQYFIYKNIILRNLYGVDIMHEATEIARLRLFLKMVAVVDVDEYDENLGLDPLPDIDFNIRCGNTLVGFANQQGVKDAILPPGSLSLFEDDYKRVEYKATDVAKLYRKFQLMQQSGELTAEFKDVKKTLDSNLKALNAELDRAMAKTVYGIDPATERGKKAFEEWKRKTQPFHWYSEFYGITIGRGGFDVIIGNPPYVEYSKVKDYKIQGYKTESCGNLYAFVIERSVLLLQANGRLGMIVPSASVCTPRMSKLEDAIGESSSSVWVSLWDERPSKLFDGVDTQLAIQLIVKGQGTDGYYITQMTHWSSEERGNIFECIDYGFVSTRIADVYPKGASVIEMSLLQKMKTGSSPLELLYVAHGSQIYYKNAGGRYWRLIKSFPTGFSSDKGATRTTTEKTFSVMKANVLYVVAALSSTLFYWFWRCVSNCRHLTDRELSVFPMPSNSRALETQLTTLGKRYEISLLKNKTELKTFNKQSGNVVQDQYHVYKSKPIIDEIDELLAKHYGFTEEELDFIINYDIKYRMGDQLNGGE